MVAQSKAKSQNGIHEDKKMKDETYIPPGFVVEEEGPLETYKKDAEETITEGLEEASWKYILERLKSAHTAMGVALEEYMHAHLDVGKHLFRVYYANNPFRVKDKNPRKQLSFKELEARASAEEERIWLKATALRNCVNVAVQDQWFTKEGVDVSAVPYTHLVILSHHKNDDTKKSLVAQIITTNMSSRDLQDILAPPVKQLEGTYQAALNNAYSWASGEQRVELERKIQHFDVLDESQEKNLRKEIKDAVDSFTAAIKHLRIHQKALAERMQKRKKDAIAFEEAAREAAEEAIKAAAAKAAAEQSATAGAARAEAEGAEPGTETE